MELDLDKEFDGIIEWDFAVKAGGKRYPIRPLEVRDLASLVAMKDNKDDLVPLRKLVASMFAGEDRPPVERWRYNVILRVIKDVTDYWQESVRKNSPSPASQGVIAGESSTSGHSRPLSSSPPTDQ